MSSASISACKHIDQSCLSEQTKYAEHIHHIKNDLSRMKTLKHLEESDIDSIADINVKILLLTYYNYFDKLKSFELDQIIDAKNDCGYNVYLVAVYCGLTEIMEFMETYCGSETNIETTDGNNAYLVAVCSGRIDIMEHLETRGSDIYAINNNGDNAYLLAAQFGHLNILKYLGERRFDIYVKNKRDNNAYILAVRFGRIETIKYLEAVGWAHIKNALSNNS
jgi:hypothetical protein